MITVASLQHKYWINATKEIILNDLVLQTSYTLMKK